MPYSVFRLIFISPVRFNQSNPFMVDEPFNTFGSSDLVFSVLCSEGFKLFGKEFVDRLIHLSNNHQFLLTSLFPFKENDYYLPLPVHMFKDRAANQPSFISSSAYLHLGHTDVNQEDIATLDFVIRFHGSKKQQCNSKVSSTVFFPLYGFNNRYTNSQSDIQESGLYFIVYYEDPALMDQLKFILESLQYSGIGSKRSLGYGKFILSPETNPSETLLKVLTDPSQNGYVSLSCILPNETELTPQVLSEAQYTLKSLGHYSHLKRNAMSVNSKPLVMFNHGSYFRTHLMGSIVPLRQETHTRVRYGKSFLIGV